MSFCTVDAATIVEGVKRLAAAIAELTNQDQTDSHTVTI